MRGCTMSFNTEATRWLGVYLDTELQFRVHKNRCLKKERKAENEVHELGRTSGLKPGLIRRIHMIAVKTVDLYGTEM